MHVYFQYLTGVPIAAPTRTVLTTVRFPPVGRPEFDNLTETQERTLIFAEYNKVKKIHPDLKMTVH